MCLLSHYTECLLYSTFDYLRSLLTQYSSSSVYALGVTILLWCYIIVCYTWGVALDVFLSSD